VHRLRGARYEKVSPDGDLHVTYVFEAGGGFAEDFLRIADNRRRLLYGRDEWMYRWALRDFFSLARKVSGIDFSSRFFAIFPVVIVVDRPSPRQIRFYREPPRNLGKEVGPTDVLVKFGEYCAAVVVDGRAYIACIPKPNGFDFVRLVKNYPRTSYGTSSEQHKYIAIDVFLTQEELEDVKRLVEGLNDMV